MDTLTFTAVLITVLPVQLCLLYAIISINKISHKIYRKVFKYMDKFTQCYAPSVGHVAIPPQDVSRQPFHINPEIIANLYEIVKKIV